jgi:hypothetical protein
VGALALDLAVEVAEVALAHGGEVALVAAGFDVLAAALGGVIKAFFEEHKFLSVGDELSVISYQ